MTAFAESTPSRPGLFVLSTPNPTDVIDFYRQVCGWELTPSSAAAMHKAAANAGEQSFLVREGAVGWLPSCR